MTEKPKRLTSLSIVFDDQAQYNSLIRGKRPDREYWTEKYLLGLVSEIDEVLREMNWKRHRTHLGAPNKENLAQEFADLTKYIFSLWELWGFSDLDMVNMVREKSDFLWQQYKQEFGEQPTDRPIVILDIDGTVGDWRRTFVEWANEQGVEEFVPDASTSLMLDQDLLMRYPDYHELKERFEAEGMYRYIEPYYDAITLLLEMKKANAYLIAFTARPSSRYKRIWEDTWHWFEDLDIELDELHIGGEPRVLMAHKLNGKCKLVMLEDDPGLALRAASSGIRVFLRSHPYNRDIKHENITRVETFSGNIEGIMKFLK